MIKASNVIVSVAPIKLTRPLAKVANKGNSEVMERKN